MVDLALAALLVGVSGFFFGGGPEGMQGAIGPAVGWWAAFIACLAASAIAFLLARRGRLGTGLLVACAPAIAAALVAFVPFHPY